MEARFGRRAGEVEDPYFTTFNSTRWRLKFILYGKIRGMSNDAYPKSSHDIVQIAQSDYMSGMSMNPMNTNKTISKRNCCSSATYREIILQQVND